MPDPASSDTTATPSPASPAAAARPGRLGPAYAKLWTAAAVSYLGDGVHDTALPLLAASLTRDPLLVAAVEVAGQLPWLLFPLPAGALVDRWDRRRVLWLVDAYRGLVVGALAAAVVAGEASIPALGLAGFLLAAGGTLFNPASMSIVPAVVSREPARLARANGRLAAAQTVGWHLLGPPLGGVLFSLARSVPLVLDALSFAISSVVLASIPGRFVATQGKAPDSGAGGGLGVAAGSVLGGLLATRLGQALGTATVLRGSAVTLGAASLGIGAITNPWAAGGLLGTIGTALAAWNVLAVSLRQAVVPDRLQGRVNSVFQQLSLGMLPVGAALGGLLGHALGLRAPFLISGAVLLGAALLAAPVVSGRAIEAARTDPR